MTIEPEEERPAPVLPRPVQAAVVLLALVAVGSALAGVLALVSALRWGLSEDGIFLDDSGPASALISVAATLSYTRNQLGAVLPVAGMVAVAVLLALNTAGRARRIDVTWRRRVAIVVVGAIGAHLLVGAVQVGIVAVAWWVVESEDVALVLAGSPFLSELQLLLPILLDVLFWAGLLALLIAARRTVDPCDPGDPETADPQAPEVSEPVSDEPVPTPSVEQIPSAPVEGPDPSPIRADGSSDSGYDEFRFRR